MEWRPSTGDEFLHQIPLVEVSAGGKTQLMTFETFQMLRSLGLLRDVEAKFHEGEFTEFEREEFAKADEKRRDEAADRAWLADANATKIREYLQKEAGLRFDAPKSIDLGAFVLEPDVLPSQAAGRTDAATRSGARADSTGRTAGAATVMRQAAAMGYRLRNGRNDFGQPGSAHASHAEKKTAVSARFTVNPATGEVMTEWIYVNRKPCSDCMGYFSALSRATGITYRVYGPASKQVDDRFSAYIFTPRAQLVVPVGRSPVVRNLAPAR
jgi:hypothetical protein